MTVAEAQLVNSSNKSNWIGHMEQLWAIVQYTVLENLRRAKEYISRNRFPNFL